jgi:hypothetical protein
MSAPQTNKNITVTKGSVGVTSAQVVGTNQNRSRIMFANVHATASVAICPTSNGAAALNTAGCLTLGPGMSVILDGDSVSYDAWNAIATGATTPLTIWEW